jgi:hypothetical protein
MNTDQGDCVMPTFDWRLLADTHKPTDAAQIAATIRHLHESGLKPHDIANVMRLGLGAVLQALKDAA